MSRTPFVGGNFKCTGTASSLTSLVKGFNDSITGYPEVEVVIAPGTEYLGLVKAVAHRNIGISAQNCVPKSGAYTGEMSAEQVKDMGLPYVILGHSERRHVFRETDAEIAAKVKAALAQKLCVIFCVGEKLDEREANKTQEVCFHQMKAALTTIAPADWKNIVIAYEPVWAIGTGKVASPEQAQEATALIRSWLSDNINASVASSTRILYGGSVNAKNCADLWARRDIDGFLVGGASTKPEFSEIVKACVKPKAKL
uniref:Triosephosphate isomerase n=1 Tax=Diplonema papillatum TaxID=91374 RepID=A0A0B6VRV0_9EUGL|nr:triose-phosphate isomerase [Diplonema papillatum]